ncbi:rhomboid family intramembrane serine protease [Stenotrophomonas sp. MYb238]|jgi:membrane associated rhomboid family serine protease|uniref:rhomboid family intramembrane serine protease n=1 Tax=Stenotrophomonas sp. MYb238 TaxID=2040281 RepID=UPI000E9391F8|nr:rhomboid family intramembrane serine protease [Stenotrophomonas sp. MYb238]MQP75518.1 rhomboid family intramembrane serine protease [Stenotrophomonas sp. MYb238]HBN55019.1 rhomboid family intramembrane serine protease [Stenotrophomonas sp.]
MFISLPSRHKPGPRWAVPLVFAAIWLAFLWSISRPDEARRSLWMDWGALSTGLGNPQDWWAALRDGSVLRLFTALFLHADWSHLLGNLVFLLIFGLPAERVLGPWRLLLLFLLGGAAANLTALYAMESPDQIIIGASGAVSALLGAYLALFPGARLGVVVPLGLFLEFVRAPAYLLIGVWAALQVVFAYIGPSFGMVAWSAHVAGFLFGIVYGLYIRAAIARRLRKRHGF